MATLKDKQGQSYKAPVFLVRSENAYFPSRMEKISKAKSQLI